MSCTYKENMKFYSKIIFQPSFDDNLEVVLTNHSITLVNQPHLISIEDLEAKEKLSVIEYKRLKEYRSLNEKSALNQWSESCDLVTEDYIDILNLLIDLAKNSEIDNCFTLDGIIVECEINTESIARKFRFHSPESSMRSYKLANSIIDLCFKKFKFEKAIRSIENIDKYFGFNLPWKITNTLPLTLRIYGSLSSDYLDLLESFFRSISHSDKLIVDLLNFQGMGTILYDAFRKLISNIDVIQWVVKEDNVRVIGHLNDLGINKQDIVISDER